MCHLVQQIHFIQKFLLCFCNFYFFLLTVFILFCFLSPLISDTLTLQPFTGYILVIFRTTLQSATCSCSVQRLRAHRQVCVQWGSVNVLYAVLTVRQKKKQNKKQNHLPFVQRKIHYPMHSIQRASPRGKSILHIVACWANSRRTLGLVLDDLLIQRLPSMLF